MKVEIPEKEIQRALKALKFYQTETKEAITKEVTLSALAIQKGAKERSPVDTGRLRSSIAVDIHGLGADIGTNVKYAPYVEFGTKRQRAQPFLYPVWEAEKNKFLAKAAKILRLDRQIKI